MVITLLMKILFIICHVPSSLFSYFLFVFVLFAPILVCLSIIIIQKPKAEHPPDENPGYATGCSPIRLQNVIITRGDVMVSR